MMWLTVGTGTDGAGTITGTFTAAGCWTLALPVVHQQVERHRRSYFHHTEGFLGAIFDVGAWQLSAANSFIVFRYSNDDGTPNGDGFVVMTPMRPTLAERRYRAGHHFRTNRIAAGVQPSSENSTAGLVILQCGRMP